ncbi:translation initiation factor IF-2 [Desulfopila aestuarii]|uniref:Translation initiation factor IF-2 n=1 Tax=Desulfopila aestuarii DSM 18488 TaxID=1121416 RepID=A0A1M7Y8E6_9BACT|nr:translation initiation factor IF-2 [Desulfopila aestuarii]SHO48889.1 bacterial translation initiation factor 2 (bIF-2) [Desulfopila aestuarii DSM 18488]
MSRVRIYELAKEAGMSSKALADKLVERGYDIKSHSSSVDDETAARIRNEVFKDSDTEMVEKRISSDQGSTVIRRRSTVIRRRPKQDSEMEDTGEDLSDESLDLAEIDEERPVQAEPSEPVQEAPKKEQQPDSSRAKVVYRPEVKTPPQPVKTAPAAPVAQKVETPAEEIAPDTAVIEKVEEKTADTVEAKTAVPVEENEPDVAVEAEASVKSPVKEQPTMTTFEKPVRSEKKRPAKAAAAPPARKGMARIVGTIELPSEQEEENGGRGSRKKPAAGSKSAPPARRPRPASSVAGPEVVAPVSADVAGRNKKRGKGADEKTFADERGSKRPGKPLKKGKNVKFTHFGDDYQRGGGKRGKKNRQKDRQSQAVAEMKASKRRIVVYETISVAELASRMRVKASEVIAKLMGLGVMATINQAVDVDTAMLIATDFGYEVEQGITEEIGIQLLEESQEGGVAEPRSPVVTVMGHVDHGKTSILDAIRKTDVAEGEAGGITQHIGAYHVRSSAGDVTFVDTPGHAAFTEMRSRGAQVTDLVILVVAADDGVMDQTREAISHSQAANVPILVAVNKIDKANADVDRVKRELSDYDLIPEDWGGQTMYCETSAKKGIGIDELMEAIQLMAEMLELKADRKRNAKGRVIEAQLDKGRGPVATVLIQEGTLKVGDYVVVGMHSGKVRAMLDDRGRNMKTAGPSIPVEVQGLSGVPQAGDEFVVVTDEKMAKNVSQARAMKAREAELGASSKISLDKLFEKMSEGDVQELRVIIRSDVQGTLEAFAKAAEELSTKDIKVRVLHEGTGTITESDILLASASEAIIIGFNVRPTVKVKELAVKENVDVRSYDVIYHALDDIRKAMVGMLEPTYAEDVIGTAEVRETFSVPKIGTIAGCGVMDGKIQRNAGVRVLRDGVVVYTGKISSLRRFKDDVKEVATGYECGIGVENFNDIKVGDHLEAFVMREVEATLE